METILAGLSQRLEEIAITLQRVGAGPDGPCHCGCGHDRGSTVISSGVSSASLAATDLAVNRTPRSKSAQAPSLAFVEMLLAAGKQRLAFLDDDLLFDPAWWMLVDLYCTELRGRRLSVTSVTIGSGVPETTALRYLRIMEERGYVERLPDETDRRRLFVEITRPTFAAMTEYMLTLEAGLGERCGADNPRP